MNLPRWEQDVAPVQPVIAEPLTTQLAAQIGQIKSATLRKFSKMFYHRGRWSSAASLQSPWSGGWRY